MDARAFETVDRLEGHTSDVLDAAFDLACPELAAAGGDGSVGICNVETGLRWVTLPAVEAIFDIACSAGGRYLAAVIPDDFVTVYILDDELLTEARSRLTRWWTVAQCKQDLATEGCPPDAKELAR